jgi:hemolysin activation/secretion protein
MSLIKTRPHPASAFYLSAWHRVAWCALILSASPALAEVTPDAGRILQETQQLNQPKPPAPSTLERIQERVPGKPAPKSPVGDVKVNVTHFTFTGNDAISTETLQAAVGQWSNRSLNFGELMQVVEAIEARYKEAGYFLAQAYLPPQKIRDGAIEISVAEGKLGETRLEGVSRVDADVVFKYLDRLPKGKAVTLPPVERQILLINELAGGHAALDLQAGEAPGSTDIVLTQTADELITGRLDISNHGSPSTGIRRAGLSMNANSPLNLGDRLSANVMATDTGNLASYSLRYELPVGGDGLHLSAAVSLAEYSLGGSLASLGASGQAKSLRMGAAYPIVRSRATNIKLQIEADQSLLNDRFSAANLEMGKRSRGMTTTLSGDSLDEIWGGGSNRADLVLRHGIIDMGPTSAILDAPPAGPGAAGSFNKANLTLMRQQTITPTLSGQLQLSYQLAGKNLDSSEKLSLGGPLTIPGYANGEGSGDAGGHVKLSLRWQVGDNLAVNLFTDYARLRLAHTPVPGATINHKQLSDRGISADLTIVGGLTASAILAWAGNEAPNPTDNAKPRFWFSMAYAW